ncbi:MAG: sorbosone dehydrogenase family protein [Spirochaetes bacterium]|nr:sorbosone dehydrogenase family protein [Spirochaetota bacterium]
MIKKFLLIFIGLNLFYQLYSITDRLKNIKLPDGFKIDLFIDNIETARGLTVSTDKTVYAGSKTGKVYAIKDLNGDFKADKIYLITDKLDMPVGVDYYNKDLYVSSVSKIVKFPDIESNLSNPGSPLIINDSLPSDRWHGWKFIKVGPDKKIYVPVGAPCNVCLKDDRRYASILRMNLDGSALELFAEGVRNTVGFDWNPINNDLWFTDNGRDRMGDNIPPDELNRAETKGLHFGFPFFHGNNIIDPGFGKNLNINKFKKPEIELGPHVAALGMRFYTGSMFPEKYKNKIFIAEHGSWNRSVPIGYRVTLVTIEKNRAVKYEVFASGWLEGRESWGRPVDVEIYHDGSLLVSDDKANAIYRIYFEKK